MQYKSPSSACLGNTSFSILVGLISILDRFVGQDWRALCPVPVEDGGVEYVKASIDLVGDKLLRFLHKTCNLASALVIDNHPIFAWLLNLGHNYGAFPAMAFVEGHHVPKGEITDDVTVEHEKGFGAVGRQEIPSQGEWTGRAQRLSFVRK